MDFEELMRSFAAEFAIDGIETDGGFSALEIDGITVAFIGDETAGTLVVAADLGVRAPDSGEALGSMLLKANYLFRALDGATLCQNPDTDAFAIQQSFAMDGMTPGFLAERVGKIVDMAEQWKLVVSGFRRAEDALAAKEAEDGRSFPHGTPGFMQV